MLAMLYDPGFVLGNITGFCAGGLAVAGLIHSGARAATARLKAETDRVKARAAAHRQSEAWTRAGAANEPIDSHLTARAQMRGGPR